MSTKFRPQLISDYALCTFASEKIASRDRSNIVRVQTG